MQKIDFNFPLNKEMQQEKEQLVQQLMKEEIIQQWLHHYQLDDDFVYHHAYRLKDYLEGKKKCEHCHGLSCCQQKKKGYYLSLEYASALDHVFIPCIYEKEKQQWLVHQRQFLLCDMSEEQLKYRFSDIQVESESPTYLHLVTEMVKACKSNGKIGFYLCGEPGTGKTYLTCCFINEMAAQGKKVAFINVSKYLSDLKNCMYDKDAMIQRLASLRKAEVAVFDDIGGESVSAWSRDEILLSILNERMEQKRLTLFTSNYDLNNIEKYYSSNSKFVNDSVGAKRLVERIRTLAVEKKVIGKNRRAHF